MRQIQIRQTQNFYRAALLLSALSAVGASVEAQNSAWIATQKTWCAVRAGVADLDALIAQKKLSGAHEIAFSVRDSARELRFGAASLSVAQKTRLDESLRRIDAIATMLDISGDKNDARGAVAQQRQLHVALDRISAIFPAGALVPVGAVTANSPVKDPVCRMTVMPQNAPGRAVYAGQTYYFCSAGDAAAFGRTPAKYAALFDQTNFGKPKNYTLSLDAGAKISASAPVHLTFAVRENGHAAPLRDFQVVHEKLMHLIVVSDDLSYFSHEHPQIGRDGRFRLNWKFPRAGRYFLFADFTPGDGLNQILRSQLVIPSSVVPGAKPQSLPDLVPDTVLSKTVEGITVTAHPAAALRAKTPILLRYSLSRNGQPITDMQPYLGAMGHMMAIHQNGHDIVHTHTIAAGGAVSGAMATPRGPNFTYELILPRTGNYKIWAQFQRHNRVITVPFTFKVQEPTMKNSPQILTALAASAALAAPSVAAPQIPAGAQKITVSLPQGYSDSKTSVRAGKTVALTFFLKSDAGCGNTIAFPAANWKKTLKVGQSATVVYTPKKSGVLVFACGMNHMKGSILVK